MASKRDLIKLLVGEVDQSAQEQGALLRALMGTVRHYFGSWKKIFAGISEPRKENYITYSLPSLLFTGVLMFLCRLGARREINYKLRGNQQSEAKFGSLFGLEQVPHAALKNG